MPKGDPIDRLAELILEFRQIRQDLLSPSTPSGKTEKEALRDGLPMPLGSVGQVLTVYYDGTRDIPAWRDPATGSGTQYRQYMVTPDPNGGAGFVVMNDGSGSPMYTLVDLE